MMMNLHLSLYQDLLWWIYCQGGEEVWPGAVCWVHLWLPGCTTLSFRLDLYLPLDQARDNNSQAALISTWLSECNSSVSQVPISTGTSSGCCRPAAQIQVLQETVLSTRLLAGREIASPLAASLCFCCVKGAAMRCKSSSLGEKSSVLLHSCWPAAWSGKHGSNSVAILTEEHFRQPWWLASGWNECLCHNFYKRVQTMLELQCRVNTNSWKALTVACLWMYWERAEV